MWVWLRLSLHPLGDRLLTKFYGVFHCTKDDDVGRWIQHSMSLYTDSFLLTTLSNTCVGKNIGIVYWTVWGSIHYLWGAGGGDYKDFEGRVAFFLCNNIILQGLIRCLHLSLNISGTCVRDVYFDSPPIMNTWTIHTIGCPLALISIFTGSHWNTCSFYCLDPKEAWTCSCYWRCYH